LPIIIDLDQDLLIADIECQEESKDEIEEIRHKSPAVDWLHILDG